MRRLRDRLVPLLKAFQKVLKEDQWKLSLLPYEQRLRADNFIREERKSETLSRYFLTENFRFREKSMWKCSCPFPLHLISSKYHSIVSYKPSVVHKYP